MRPKAKFYDPIPGCTAVRAVTTRELHSQGGDCEDCGHHFPTLVELAEHYAPPTHGGPHRSHCPARRPHANQPVH